MGKKADDIEREIEELRVETDRLLEELERRLKETINVRAQAQQHPLVTTAITLALIAGTAMMAYSAFFRHRFKPPAHKAKEGFKSNTFATLKDLGANAFDVVKTVLGTVSRH